MYKVRKQKDSSTWGVYKGTVLVEGGFFGRAYAEGACYEWNKGKR